MSAPSAESFTSKILLDSPTAMPALGYHEIGQAFATIITQSEPRFAIGIFGGWGSGKTTLMKAIKAALPKSTAVIVDFNAWRFEREPQLLVPLLDTIRAALIQWSEQYDASTRKKVRSIATSIGHVVRALATGLSGEVGLPGTAKVNYDVGKALNILSNPRKPENAQSLYVAAFQELERAFEQLSASGITRVVVFVDDLDRCFPANELDLLESMKLFFDLPGFVFVVGLDEDAVERAICAKFPDGDRKPAPQEGESETAALRGSRRLGREYVKKIFQVPYTLPAVVPEELDRLLESMCREAALGPAQIEDLQTRVRPYLDYVAKDRRVNPREVKRFINTYTLQTLVRPDLDADTVLALQTLSFPYEWQILYNAILANEASFREALKQYRQSEESNTAIFSELSADLRELPSDLVSFLRSRLVEALARQDSLDPYISTLKSTILKSAPTSHQDLPSGNPPPGSATRRPSFCLTCGQEIQPDEAFCGNCGSPRRGSLPSQSTPRAPYVCRTCGWQIGSSDFFCGSCGTPVPRIQ